MIGEVVERELVLVVSVKCDKERDMTRGWQTVLRRTQACNLELLGPCATRVRVMKSGQTVQCDVLTHCAHLYILCEWVFCSQFLNPFLPQLQKIFSELIFLLEWLIQLSVPRICGDVVCLSWFAQRVNLNLLSPPHRFFNTLKIVSLSASATSFLVLE